MSALFYASLTSRRLAATAPVDAAQDDVGAGPPPAKTGVAPFVEAMAALVPAEVLAAHAAIIGLVSSADEPPDGGLVTKVGYPNYVAFAFWSLIVIAGGLYLLGRRLSNQKMRPIDALLMLIPPSAFVAWTMLQPATALDVVAPAFQVPGRVVVGIIVAVVLAALARWGGVRASDMDPEGR